jgi:hypothetical protein
LKRNVEIGFRKTKKEGSYSDVFLFAALIIILATNSSIPSSLATKAVSE